MRIFKTSWFNRFCRKHMLADARLIAVAAELKAGIFDADLGGGVFKKRVARTGEGKSGGFRTMICFRKGDRVIFVYAFTKSDRKNIGPGELEDLKKLAAVFLAMSWAEIELAVNSGKLMEIGGSVKNV